MKKIEQTFSVNFNYPVCFSKDLFSEDNTVISDLLEQHRNSQIIHKILFVVDRGVCIAQPDLKTSIINYFSALQGHSLVDTFIEVTGGETAKNSFHYVDTILDAIDRFAIDRHSYIFIVGGGAVLDMAGLAASIGHRGVRHIRIPTTVLAQNDSGVGVKNGVNLKGKKNFIGAFVPPFAVLNDSSFLTTLDKRNWLAGISEAIKVALIKDYTFFEWIENNAQALVERSEEEMEYLIYRCAEMHLEHIRSGDPFEFGSSRPLDFGHWSAHKLEQLSDFSLLHGEAVAIGIALDTVYSYKINNLLGEDRDRVLNLFVRLGLPIYHQQLVATKEDNPVLKGLEEFREHLGGRLSITLLEKLGIGKEYHSMDTELLLESISYLHEINSKANVS